MRLPRVQAFLKEKKITFSYTEEDGCASIDFILRGLEYHIWEFADGDEPCGAETNLMHAGHMEDVTGAYEDELLRMLEIIA